MPREIPPAFATRSDERSTSFATAPDGSGVVQLADERKLWALTATVLAATAVIALALITFVAVPSQTFPPLASIALLRIGAVVSTPEKVMIPPAEPEVELKLHV